MLLESRTLLTISPKMNKLAREINWYTTAITHCCSDYITKAASFLPDRAVSEYCISSTREITSNIAKKRK
ncbi:hypothetical protein BaLi_c10680 [Bacillus paralicheniformis ATCC 9945a]|nr:hypothetical protein BaLi_c10680 [Bacillus paralicheniformis ATCC 9945a]